MSLPLRIARAFAFTLGAASLAWAALLALTASGVDARVLGIGISSTDPWRPLAVGIAALAVFGVLGGRPHLVISWTRAAGRTAPQWLVVALPAMTLVLGVTYATTTASGADAYGYVSQADLWLEGDLTIDQPAVEDMDWRLRRWSFSPLGYRPVDDPATPWTIVPVYAPGLPMLLAVAKGLGGQEAMFWVVPLTGALLVLATWGLGRRLGAPGAGLAAAWLVATSPPLLFMLMAPMTDVPVAAAWTAAFYLLLGRSRASAWGAGLAAGIAVLIRPNLVVLVPALGLWYAARARSGEESLRRGWLGDALAFGLGVLPGVAAVAIIHDRLYGSPFVSGYGRLEGMFAVSHIWPNLRNYASWLVEVQTPAALLGLAAILIPARRLWPAVRSRAVFVPIGVFVTTLWLYYCAYLVFDVWWYLRFMLPVLPFVMLGIGAMAALGARVRAGRFRGAVILIVILLGVAGLRAAAERNAFNLWREERRYVAVARLVERFTDPDSVIISMQHSGSLRYYAGRTTLHFEQLEGTRLDHSIRWLSDRGVSVYLLLEDWEIPRLRSRFGGERTLARLDDPPIFVYHGTATVQLFEVLGEPPVASAVFEEMPGGLRSVPPAPPPALLGRRLGSPDAVR